jgi:hypothetical protein
MFSKSSTKKGNLHNICKSCDSRRHRLNRKLNGDKLRKKAREYRASHIDDRVAYDRQMYKKHAHKKRKTKRVHREVVKEIVLHMYGSKCTTCGEDNPSFLAIDHVNNDGHTNRKPSHVLYREIIRDGFPTKFQLLCHNCNLKKEIAHKRSMNKNTENAASQRERYRRVKLQVLNHYGTVCSCCGNSDIEVLTVDHVHGGGTGHYKEIGQSRLYRWLISNNFPAGFQILCMNCNYGKYQYGRCPHKLAGIGGISRNEERHYTKFVHSLSVQRRNQVDDERNIHTNEMSFELLHAIMGMSTESAELMDLLKKHLAYERKIDRLTILDESADCLFYLTMVLLEMGSSISELMKLNMAKLKARYPNGYTHADANNRNGTVETVAQRKAVEK